jgi:hypothetical protein
MARLNQFFSYIHNLILHLPQNGYHNISKLMQPQMRCISESFTANPYLSNKKTKGLKMKSVKPAAKPDGRGQVAGAGAGSGDGR